MNLIFKIVLLNIFILPLHNLNAFQDTTGISRDTIPATENLFIDTAQKIIEDIPDLVDTTQLMIDTTVLIMETGTKSLSNTELFIYILLTIAGFVTFYFVFVQTLFRTFHKTKSTRQSLLLSWNLFFLVSLIWGFILWGIVANFWTSTAFFVSMIFLILVNLVMLIISIKTRN